VNSDTVALNLNSLVRQFGGWTNHNIRLAPDLYTMGPSATGAEVKLRRFTQVAVDFFGGSLSGIRALDLACLEGLYGLELALRGASVVAVEGRESNLAKARFAGEALGVRNIEFVRDDVRNLRRERYGTFDLVLCIGIFYHLDAPDVFRFAESIADVCTRIAIVDTHVATASRRTYVHKGRVYRGRHFREDDTPWAAIGNRRSVWLTRSSLYELLQEVGFTSVYECRVPDVPKYDRMRRRGSADRSTFIAMKGRPVRPMVIDRMAQ
jgi:SAM-dependent methyltransferase